MRPRLYRCAEDDEDDDGDDDLRPPRRFPRLAAALDAGLSVLVERVSRLVGLEYSEPEVPRQATLVTGVSREDCAGAVSVIIRLVHDFAAEDVTFEGSSEGARIYSVICGDELIFSSADSVPLSIFSPSSPLRDLVKGERSKMRAGTSIVVNGAVMQAGDRLQATFFGSKPAPARDL